MEKMGWSAGKGLGLNEQGIQEPLKVSFKNDTKGMGFKGNDDDWIEQQDEFNILLNQLRNQDDTSVVKGSDAEKSEVKSLEEKSKQSKARVHYQKFTRGKDLSRYSENDLACILGTNKVKKKENSKTEETIETKINGNCETSFGVTTINSGSINDYFKKKRTADKVKTNDLTEVDGDGEDKNFRPSFSIQSEESEKVHKFKYEEGQLPLKENETPESGFVGSIEKVRKKKRKKETEINLEAEPESKKRRKNADIIGENSLEEPESLLLESESICDYGEKRKKVKKITGAELPVDEFKLRKEKKERKGTKRDSEEFTVEELQETKSQKTKEINSINHRDASVEMELVKRKKKKKDKKKKLEGNELCEIVYNNDNRNDKLLNGSCLEVEPVKNKKDKKHKKQKLKKSDDRKDSSDTQDVSLGDQREKTDNQGILAMASGKKKKKKSKKEKIKEFDETNQVLASGETGVEVNDENELESDKKKRKKENKEIENESCGNQIEEPCTAGTVAEKTVIQSKEEESVKKKKKKKDKKEKLIEVESKDEGSCLGKSENDEENAEFSTKKKKNKDKRVKVEDNEGSKNIGEQSCQFNPSDASKEVGNEAHIKKTELIRSNGVLNTNPEERMHKLRANLFPDTAAEKYFPQQSTNERVLKLIRWANIEEFKGSNLKDVEGYGRRKAYEKQSR